ncbi:hypothetical protein, partial [Breoghania sp. JC706]|uniref:hypothetical protein n=1 Tax=Breoghania sp. JC706 TaxID=3117732 RepID=UPI00300A679D
MTNRLVLLNQAAQLAARFGSQSKLAAALGSAPTTINRWCRAGYVRPIYFSQILSAAEALGIQLTEKDFALVRDATAEVGQQITGSGSIP